MIWSGVIMNFEKVNSDSLTWWIDFTAQFNFRKVISLDGIYHILHSGIAFNKADKAMYLAKEQGKNKVVFCSKLERSLEIH
jgi:hypothetical protein